MYILLPDRGHPLSQPLRAASSPTGEPSLTSPERGGGAQRRRGQARYAEYQSECTKANSHNPSLPPLGVVLRAANQDNNDCRWQSYLCFVPRSGKGGVVGNFELLPFNEPHPLSQAVRPASSPIGEPRPLLPPLGEVPR